MSIHWDGRGHGHGSRWPRAAGSGGAGGLASTIILNWVNQSNPLSWTMPNGLNPNTDPVDSRIVQMIRETLGPELFPNGDFSGVLSGWVDGSTGVTRAIENGRLKLTTSGAGSNKLAYASFTGCDIGETYRVQFDFEGTGTGLNSCAIFNSTGGSQVKKRYCTNDRDGGFPFDVDFVATDTTHRFYVLFEGAHGAGSVAYLDNISIKKKTAATGGTEVKPAQPMRWFDYDINEAAMGTALPLFIASRLLERQPSLSKIVMLPTGAGATGLVGGPWDPDTPGSNYTRMIAMLGEARTLNPTARVVNCWWQGETDANASTTQAAYFAKASSVVAGIRAVAPGSQLMVFGMNPDWIAVDSAARTPVHLAHQQMATDLANTVFVPCPTGYGKSGDIIHVTIAGIALQGIAGGNAYNPWGA